MRTRLADSHVCDHPECAAAGTYPAPKGRERLRDYYWFCLDHVRAYNRGWDYCAGLGEADIEQLIRAATCWERPTWRLGHWHGVREEAARSAFTRDFAFAADGSRRDKRSQHDRRQRTPDCPRDKALAVLGLAAAATQTEIRARYKYLVKRYHPDANGGDKRAEERLKVINQAYATLRMRAPA